jgi:hypothetical protein
MFAPSLLEPAMQHHFILTLGRSGSNFLVDVINQHPNLTNYGEILGKWMIFRKVKNTFAPWMPTEAYLDMMLRSRAVFTSVHIARRLNRLGKPGVRLKRRKDVHSTGIKDFSLLLDMEDLGDWPIRRKDLRIIMLTRSSVIDRAISTLLLGATGVVATTGEYRESPRLDVSPEIFLATMDAVAQENERLREIADAVESERRLDLVYEDIFDREVSLEAAVQNIYSFLGVSPMPFVSRQRKIVRTSPEQTLVHWDEIRAAARNGPHQRWFD